MTFDKSIAVDYSCPKNERGIDIGWDCETNITYIVTNEARMHGVINRYVSKHPEDFISAKRTIYTNGIENWDVKLKGTDIFIHN